MDIRSCQIIYRYGEDDFSVWDVDIDIEEYEKITNGGTFICGQNVEEILMLVPIGGNRLHFYSRPNLLWIHSCESNQDFMDKYGYHGCSVRGDLEDILEELIEEV